MSSKSPVWYRDKVVLARLSQAAALGLVLLIIAYLLHNAQTNMSARGMHLDPNFLWTTAPFKIGFTPFLEFVPGQTRYWEIFVIGALNTLLVAVLGIVSSTILGVVIGVMRLSQNLLARRMASAFIETFRNLPLLLQVFFWHFIAILPMLPARQESWVFGAGGLLNREGLFLSRLSFAHPLAVWVALGLIVAAIVAVLVRRGALSVSLLAAVAIGAFWIAGPRVSEPQIGRMGVEGGFWIPVPLLSLWWALTIATSAFIAEVVRAGIIAIPAGQREASLSLGLSRLQSLRLVELPQALRIIIPPTISQYLNLLKNSSLAVAVGYDDIVNIWMGATLNQTGQAILIIAATMAFFTTFSLLTSYVMNAYNARVQIRER